MCTASLEISCTAQRITARREDFHLLESLEAVTGFAVIDEYSKWWWNLIRARQLVD